MSGTDQFIVLTDPDSRYSNYGLYFRLGVKHPV